MGFVEGVWREVYTARSNAGSSVPDTTAAEPADATTLTTFLDKVSRWVIAVVSAAAAEISDADEACTAVYVNNAADAALAHTN